MELDRTWRTVKPRPTPHRFLKVDSSGATIGHGLIVIASSFPFGAGQDLAVVSPRQVLPRVTHRLLKLDISGATIGHGLIVIVSPPPNTKNLLDYLKKIRAIEKN